MRYSVLDVDVSNARIVIDLLRCPGAGASPEAFVSVGPMTEPLTALRAMASNLRDLSDDDATAVRIDPATDGLSIEVKRPEGEDCEVVLWLDLVRLNPAFKLRATRGRHQAGLRLHARATAVSAFAAALLAAIEQAPAPVPIGALQ